MHGGHSGYGAAASHLSSAAKRVAVLHDEKRAVGTLSSTPSLVRDRCIAMSVEHSARFEDVLSIANRYLQN